MKLQAHYTFNVYANAHAPERNVIDIEWIFSDGVRRLTTHEYVTIGGCVVRESDAIQMIKEVGG